MIKQRRIPFAYLTAIFLLLLTTSILISAQASDSNSDAAKSTEDAGKVDSSKPSKKESSVEVLNKTTNASLDPVKQGESQAPAPSAESGQVPTQNQTVQAVVQSQQNGQNSSQNLQSNQTQAQSSQSGQDLPANQPPAETSSGTQSGQDVPANQPPAGTSSDSQSGQVSSQNQQPAQNPESGQTSQGQQPVQAPDSKPQPDQPPVQSPQSGESSGEASGSNQQTGEIPSQNQQSDHVQVTNQTSNQQSDQNSTASQKDVASSPTANASKIIPEDKQPPASNGSQVSSNDPANPVLPVDKHDKSLLTICDICSCSDNLYSNPYYVNCTKSLSNHVIPPWGKLLDTTVTEVDNVHLLLQLNGFETVPVIAKSMPIDAIDFSHNAIYSIEPFAFGGLPHLKRLTLSNNNLNNLNVDAFNVKDLASSNLEVLDLSYNQLTHLPNDIFQKTQHLEELNLEGNPFQVLDSSTIAALNSLMELQTLNLANMELTELPMGLINPIQHLYVLNLADNNFERVPEVIQHGTNLEHLILSGNLMTEFGAYSFIELKNLKALEINNLQHLTAIHKGTFFPFKFLTKLQCHSNPHLSTIELRAFNDENGDGLQRVDMLELQNNNLTTLDVSLFKHVQVINLNLGGNPWNCSCELYWIKTDASTMDYIKEVKCHEPTSLKGKSFEEVDFESDEVPCPPGWHNPDHRSFSDITYVVTETYSFWIFVLLVGLMLLIAITVIVFRTKPQWQYKIMKIVVPQKAEYRTEKNTTNVRYMRQFDDDQGFSEDVITEYCAQRDRNPDNGV